MLCHFYIHYRQDKTDVHCTVQDRSKTGRMEDKIDGGHNGWRTKWMEDIMDGGHNGWRTKWMEDIMDARIKDTKDGDQEG